jgi:cob(I)alamin adenosyltransferase
MEIKIMVNEKNGYDNRRTPFDKGYVQVYTGDGKGKTTAAIGLAVRAAGAGMKVLIGQFIKSGKYSEMKALDRFSDLITCRQFGKGCWIRGNPSEEDARLAREGLEEMKTVIAGGDYQLVILDEADVAVSYDLLGPEELVGLIDMKPEKVELVFTGRKADALLIERADLVTEMREIKHYYKRGVIARKGIES